MNCLKRGWIYNNITTCKYSEIPITEGWTLLKMTYTWGLPNPIDNYYYVIHKECFDHYRSKWQKSPFQGANINKRSVSCWYCKARSSRDVMKRIKFLLGLT